MVLGEWLTVGPETEQITKAGAPASADSLDRANQLVRGSYRSPFVIPDRL
jgi:hypothetical protein